MCLSIFLLSGVDCHWKKEVPPLFKIIFDKINDKIVLFKNIIMEKLRIVKLELFPVVVVKKRSKSKNCHFNVLSFESNVNMQDCVSLFIWRYKTHFNFWYTCIFCIFFLKCDGLVMKTWTCEYFEAYIIFFNIHTNVLFAANVVLLINKKSFMNK